jgi:hypothetical protein
VKLNRRRFVLASLAAAALPAVARAQTTTPTTGGCAIGFVNGLLQFSEDCEMLDIPGLGMQVAPPSHMVGLVSDGTTSSTNQLQAERQERLQKKRSKKRRKQDRQQGKHDNRRNRRSRLRDNRKRQRGARRLPVDSTVSGTGPNLSSTFELAAGHYTASASVTGNSPGPSGPFTATLLGPSGFASTLFNTLTVPGTNVFQTTVDLPEGGYIWDVDAADSGWTLKLVQV